VRGTPGPPGLPAPTRAAPAGQAEEPAEASLHHVPDGSATLDTSVTHVPDAATLLEAAFAPDSAALASFDPLPIVAAFAARLQLGNLRDGAAARLRTEPGDLRAHVLLLLANWELGAAREASLALTAALDSDSARSIRDATEAILDFCPPELRAIEIRMRRELLERLLGARRVRHLLHDACMEADRPHDAEAELLAELRPIAARWATAAAEADTLEPLLARLQAESLLTNRDSGYGPLDGISIPGWPVT